MSTTNTIELQPVASILQSPLPDATIKAVNPSSTLTIESGDGSYLPHEPHDPGDSHELDNDLTKSLTRQDWPEIGMLQTVVIIATVSSMTLLNSLLAGLLTVGLPTI